MGSRTSQSRQSLFQVATRWWSLTSATSHGLFAADAMWSASILAWGGSETSYFIMVDIAGCVYATGGGADARGAGRVLRSRCW